MTKHSRQRDAIYANLCSRKDHPTAEDIYMCLKPEFPALSLATVYRNLDMLVRENMVLRISVNGADRFDGDISTHPHFICDCCGKVIDIVPEKAIDLSSAFSSFGGKIKSQVVILKGTCPECA